MEPKIRLKGFSGEWKEFCIEDTATLKAGKTFNFARDYDKIFPCYGGNGIRGYVDVASHKGLFPIIGRQGALCGNVILAEGEFYATEHAVVVTPKNGNNAVFLYYDYIVANLNQYATGCAQPGLSVDNINKVGICVPSLPEQTAIANYFTNLDTLIQSTAKQLDKLRNIKAASLQSLFPQPGEKKTRVRFKGFEGDWKDVKVGDMGYSYAGLTGKTKDDFGCGDAKYITFMNVLTNAKVDTSILDSVCVARGERQNEVKKGDLLFNTSSETPQEVGFCCAMLDDIRNVYLNSFCFGFRLTDSDIDPLFISYLMRSNVGRRIMSILAQGATRYNLSKKNFMNTYLSIPSELKEQQKISEYLQSLDTQIRLQEQRLEKLRNIKSACLDNMFV